MHLGAYYKLQFLDRPFDVCALECTVFLKESKGEERGRKGKERRGKEGSEKWCRFLELCGAVGSHV